MNDLADLAEDSNDTVLNQTLSDVRTNPGAAQTFLSWVYKARLFLSWGFSSEEAEFSFDDEGNNKKELPK